MTERLRLGWRILRGAVGEARTDDVPTMARALAFSLFLAVPAVLLVLLGALSVFGDEGTVQELVDRLRGVLPSEATMLLEDSLRRTSSQTSGGVAMAAAGFALALWTTTSAATTLMKALTTAFDREESRGFLRSRVVALLIVVVLSIGALLVLALLVLGPHVERWLGDATGAETLTSWVWWTAQWPILVLALLFAFGVVLSLGPDAAPRQWRLVTPGAVVALVLWLGASGAFSLYVSHFGSYEKTWGTLSAVVVTLLWLWLTSAALLLGAEVNAEAERASAERDHRHDPVAQPELVAPAAPRLGGMSRPR